MESKKAEPLSFHEYRLMYESAERVTDRRFSLNRSNYAICLGIIVANAVIANWAIGKSDPYYAMALFGIFALSALAIVFCVGWINFVTDLKNLNNVKFQVMDLMSQRIRFETDYGEEPISFNPFQKEWDLLQDAKATSRVRGLETLQGGKFEYLLPSGLILVYLLVISGVCLLAAFRYMP